MHFNQSEPHPPDVADLTFIVPLNSLLLLSRELRKVAGAPVKLRYSVMLVRRMLNLQNDLV